MGNKYEFGESNIEVKIVQTLCVVWLSETRDVIELNFVRSVSCFQILLNR